MVVKVLRRLLGPLALGVAFVLRPWPQARINCAHRIRRLKHFRLRIEIERHFSEQLLAAAPARGMASLTSGSVISVDTADIIQRSVAVSGAWEPVVSSLMEGLLSEGDSFVDAGANIGYYSLLAAPHIGPTAYFKAIEASPRIFSELKANLERNGIDGDVAVHAAVVDGQDFVEVVNVPWPNLGAVMLREVSVELESQVVARVPGLSLGELAAQMPSDRPAVIKIDIEGAEFAARQGIEALVVHGPSDLAVLIEVVPDAAAGYAVTRHSDDETRAHEAIPENLAQAGGMSLYAVPNSYSPGGRYPEAIPPLHKLARYDEDVHDYLLIRGEEMAARLEAWMATTTSLLR